MNSKRAKALRNLAGGNTASYSNLGSPRTYQLINGFPFLTAKGTSRTLSTDCTRFTYQQLKRLNP